jgi:transcriptional regulator with XRE-family HTH domain
MRESSERSSRELDSAPAREVRGKVRAVRSGAMAVGVESSAAFVDWLRLEMRHRRISQRMLAARAGISHSTVSRMLKDERSPTFETAQRLARALDPHARLGQWEIDRGSEIELLLAADPALRESDAEALIQAYRAARQRSARTPPKANGGEPGGSGRGLRVVPRQGFEP